MIKLVCPILLSIHLLSYAAGSEQDKALVSFFQIRRQSLQYQRRMLDRHRRFIMRNEPLGPIKPPDDFFIFQLQLQDLKKQRLEEIGRQVAALGLELKKPEEKSKVRKIYKV